jgi:hypothetical protein
LTGLAETPAPGETNGNGESLNGSTTAQVNGDTNDSSFLSKITNATAIEIGDDPIENNKRHIIADGDTLGYAYIIYEPIPCPVCSDVNYLLVADKKYRIREFIHLRDMVESHQIIPLDEFEKFSDQFIGKSILENDFTDVPVVAAMEKHTIYFKGSVLKLQKQTRLFYEK